MLLMKLGFVTCPNTLPLSDFSEIFNDRSRPSIISAQSVLPLFTIPCTGPLRITTQTEGIGTVRSHEGGPIFEDDGSLSSENYNDGKYEEDEDAESPPLSHTCAFPHILASLRRLTSARRRCRLVSSRYAVYTYSVGSRQDACGG